MPHFSCECCLNVRQFPCKYRVWYFMIDSLSLKVLVVVMPHFSCECCWWMLCLNIHVSQWVLLVICSICEICLMRAGGGYASIFMWVLVVVIVAHIHVSASGICASMSMWVLLVVVIPQYPCECCRWLDLISIQVLVVAVVSQFPCKYWWWPLCLNIHVSVAGDCVPCGMCRITWVSEHQPVTLSTSPVPPN